MDADFLEVIQEISDKLIRKGLKLGVAESCTGGLISHSITDLPGASRFFSVAVVSYTEESKKYALGVSAALLKKHGTVSEETAVAMAEGIRKLGKTDVSLSVTGIAGPEAVEGKEVGLVYMAAAIGDMVESTGIKLDGNREEIKRQASLEALRFLKRVLDPWL